MEIYRFPFEKTPLTGQLSSDFTMVDNPFNSLKNISIIKSATIARIQIIEV